MCSRLAEQVAHIGEEEVAVPVHLLHCPDPSCCHCLYRHNRTHVEVAADLLRKRLSKWSR